MHDKIDLHIHTSFSDGAYSPEEIVRRCTEAGLNKISITDHDSIDAIPHVREHAKEQNIEVIPGVELSSEMMNNEVHILGYYIDINNSELIEYLRFFRDERLRRVGKIIKKLNNLGLEITVEDVINDLPSYVAVGRPHIAQAMYNKGLVSSYYDAFNKYLKNNGPAYEKKVHISPVSAYKIINEAGGLAIIAHPGNMQQDILKYLIEAGADGIEVVHPSHNETLTKHYQQIANAYFLLASGGSDFHGGKRNDEQNLGKYHITQRYLEAMQKRLIKDSA
ncbi:MAG: PHP domain-containing protein [Ignavibacteriales bacterium]|jgi:predicted metal-dependent phosphoesterase TrpH|nr:PHP domain-containing protein [Ignavibacteriaceae bacterium]NLH60810.1 PHP domain-containing protein [Ignavibacteriales bacterium]HOJ18018.1 PHP domain-containing protein [Ignavibacteriaceae bacterium]HPO56214.1 PHP domain-containing protein [Ignavibacteriaceae bacterium]